MMKGVNKRIGEGVLWLFGHVERMENDRIDKKVYVRECVGSSLVSRPWKRWMDTEKECLKEVWMSGKQGEWWMIRVNPRRL